MGTAGDGPAFAVVAAMAIPLGMSAWPEIGGAIQRLMFAVAYTWYGTEAVREIREPSPAVS